MPSHWTCRKCKTVNVRTSSRRCGGCGEETKRARRETVAAKGKREIGYPEWAILSVLIHGGEPHACAVCGRPRDYEADRHHREHDRATGLPRGLACAHCNQFVLGTLSLEQAQMAFSYLVRVDLFYSALGIKADAPDRLERLREHVARLREGAA